MDTGSERIKTKLADVLLLCWKGNIKLWKAFWLVNVLGSFIIVIITIISAYIFGPVLPLFFYGAPVTVYAVFSAVTLWRASSDLTDYLFRGKLIKTYIIIYSICMFPIILALFGSRSG